MKRSIQNSKGELPYVILSIQGFIRFFTLVLSLLILSKVNGQSFQASAIADKTVVGLERGLEVGYITEKGWGAKGFYQQLHERNESEVSAGLHQLAGISLQMPLKQCGGMGFYFNTKAAFADTKYLVVIPELLTQVNLARHLSIGLRTGLRKGQPAMGLQLNVQL